MPLAQNAAGTHLAGPARAIAREVSNTRAIRKVSPEVHLRERGGLEDGEKEGVACRFGGHLVRNDHAGAERRHGHGRGRVPPTDQRVIPGAGWHGRSSGIGLR